MNNFVFWSNCKEFWLTDIETRKIYMPKRKKFSVSNLEVKIKEQFFFKELDELGRKLRKEIYEENLINWSYGTLGTDEEEKLKRLLDEDLKNFEKYHTKLSTELENYRKKLESIIQENSLTNWEEKIVKKDASNKKIENLQDKIKKLQTEKDNLNKELKETRDQYLNHDCNTSNNAELNQVKNQLKQIIQERDKLQEQLNSRESDTQEEDIDNLTFEELKKKVHQKEEEIFKLKSEVKSNHNPNNSNNTNYGLWFLVLSGFLIIVFASIIILQKKKKNGTRT